MRKVLGAVGVAALALALAGCWSNAPTSGARVGGPASTGVHYAWESSGWGFYGCPVPKGSPRCNDHLKIGLGSLPEISNGGGGGLPAYRADWKSPANLSVKPAGSPTVVLRIEMTNTVAVSGATACGAPGSGTKQVVKPSGGLATTSAITAINCTVTADKRMLVDIGLKKKSGYQIVRCYNPSTQMGVLNLGFQPPADGAPWTHGCIGTTY